MLNKRLEKICADLYPMFLLAVERGEYPLTPEAFWTWLQRTLEDLKDMTHMGFEGQRWYLEELLPPDEYKRLMKVK
jgi:hypothetical protein